MKRIKDILSSDYQLLTDEKHIDFKYKTIFATDLLSSLIKYKQSEIALITMILSPTTLLISEMLDIKVCIIVGDVIIDQALIEKANKKNIAIIHTKLHTHQVIIDFYQRNLI